jgi:protein TonB
MFGRLSFGPLLAIAGSAILHVIALVVVQAAAPFTAPAVREPLLADLVISEPPPPPPPRIEPPRPIRAPAPARVEPPRPQVEPPRPVMVQPPPPAPLLPKVEPTPGPPVGAQAPAEKPVAPPAPAAPVGPPVGVPRADPLPASDAATAAAGISMTANSAPAPAAHPPAPVTTAPSRPAPAAVAALPPGPQSLQEAVGSGRLGVVNRPGPRYPESARRAGAQGTTLLKVHVLDDGSLADIKVEESAGHAALDRAALDAVRRWKFEPGRQNGKPVALWVLIPFEFRLR